MKTSKSHREGKKGTIVVIAGLGLTAIVGAAALAVDYGLMVNDMQRIQRTAEAAALSGACKLNDLATTYGSSYTSYSTYVQYQVTQDTQSVAALNGVPMASVSTSVDTIAKLVTVNASSSRASLFAGVLGFALPSKTKTAQAGVYSVTQVGGPAPIAMTTTDFNNWRYSNTSHTFTLERNQGNSFDAANASGNGAEFLGLSVQESNGKSPKQWEDACQYGDDVPMTANDNNSSTTTDAPLSLNAATAQVNKGYDAFLYRWNNNMKTFPMAVCDPCGAGTGNSPHQIQKICYVELTAAPITSGSGNSKVFRMQLKIINTPVNSDSALATTSGSTDTGMTTVKLSR